MSPAKSSETLPASRPVRFAIVFYGAMGLLAAAGMAWSETIPWAWHPRPPLIVGGLAQLASFLSGLAIAGVTIAVTPALQRHAPWARNLSDLVRQTFEGCTGRDVLMVALASGIGEELFFRGLLQPQIGLLLSSIVFGAVHIGGRRLWPWAVFAAAIGLVLGLLFEAFGTLLGPVVAHATINGVNLHRILREESVQVKSTRR